jgi:hypothetical protein
MISTNTIKWIGTLLIVSSVVIRSIGLPPYLDLGVSIPGTIAWLYVAIAWRDKSMIVLNCTILIFLLYWSIR